VNGTAALQYAAEKNNLDVCRLLIEKGAALEAADAVRLFHRNIEAKA
jgi:ankyrin repeat protein